jgi:predicted CXXCH cytochrome family protein
MRLVCAVGGLWVLAASPGWGESLSAGRGPPADYAGAEGTGHATLTCSDCHAPILRDRDAYSVAPVWNPFRSSDNLPVFRLYRSPSFDRLGTDISQPDGASKLCLGCHDGSYTGPCSGCRNGLRFSPDDLARSHPISFTFDSSLAMRARTQGLRDPAVASSGLGGTIRQDLLDERSRMQCTSCHSPHPSAYPRKLLRYPYDPAGRDGAAFCRVCHAK